MRVDEWLRDAQQRLQTAGVEGARLEAQVLAAHALGVDRSWVLAHPEASVPNSVDEVLSRRLKREPLAYVLGYREFYGRRFRVAPGVLIPRQETEVLVDVALEVGGGRVLDIGTGSGCIATSLKLERPPWTILACDISWEALQIAQWNLKALHADVALAQCDSASAFASGSLDLIVSNPPYVSRGAVTLMPEIAEWEPEVALYGEDAGFGFYRRLSHEASRVLHNGGTIAMELGAGQATEVRSLFEQRGWKFVGSWNDLSGIERVIAFRK